MAFLYPSFIFAAFAVLIPIAIHLFSFRSFKTVYFSNIKFLKNVEQETKSRSQLKHLLVLLCRILAILSMVFAFAQPYSANVQRSESQKEDVVAIYFDNSFSMIADSKYGQLMEVAKQKARTIIESYRPGSKFVFTTNDFEDKHQRIVNRDQIIDFINKTTVSPNVRRMSNVLNRQMDVVNSESASKETNRHTTSFLLSDFQKATADFNTFNQIADSSFSINIVPLATQATNNLYIDSCWFATPKRKLYQAEVIFIKINNKSDQDYNDIPVKLTINDTLKALGSFNIASNSEKIVELTYTNTTTGILNGKIEITDYPIVYDNNFYFSYKIAGNIKVMAINGKGTNAFIEALFSDDEYFEIESFSEDNIKISAFSNFNVIIINSAENITSGIQQEIVNFANNGGTVLFIPSQTGNIATYNQFLSSIGANTINKLDTAKTVIASINYENELYQNTFRKIDEKVNLPVIFSHYVFEQQIQTNENDILNTTKGDKILSELTYGSGRIFILSASLNPKSTNFATHPLFVPTLYNIALYSQMTDRIYYTIGTDEVINIKATNIGDKSSIKVQKDDYNFIPYYTTSGVTSGLRIDMQGNISEEGNYIVKVGDTEQQPIAYNYNRSESDLSYYESNEISEYIDNNKYITIINANSGVGFGSALEEVKTGKQYWKYLIILALIFIAGEIVIIRFIKD